MLPTIHHRQAIKLVMDPWTLAQAKIGQWSLGLEKSTPGPQKKDKSMGVDVTKTKTNQLEEAGYTKQLMHKREQLAQAPLISATPGQRGRALWRQ
ncbi:MAG: hypothetical protein GY928_34780 [Colwellia sp.]|nr:hypothetical protein [Colwellia sp.]